MKLKQDDIIEYQSRMSQFRLQVEQQETMENQTEIEIKCPRCGRSEMGVTNRGYSLVWGL